MKNKTIAQWLIWTLGVTFVLAILQIGNELVGLTLIVNWAWVIVAIVRLYKQAA